MKKQFLLLATALLVGTTTMYAQGGFQRQTPEEILKPIHEKIDSAFKLTAEKLAKVDSVFLESFKQQEANMAELRSGGERPDREAMMAMRQQLADERDNKLKEVLTEEQMKIWKNELEPSLRPQRGGGNRGGGN